MAEYYKLMARKRFKDRVGSKNLLGAGLVKEKCILRGMALLAIALLSGGVYAVQISPSVVGSESDLSRVIADVNQKSEQCFANNDRDCLEAIRNQVAGVGERCDPVCRKRIDNLTGENGVVQAFQINCPLLAKCKSMVKTTQSQLDILISRVQNIDNQAQEGNVVSHQIGQSSLSGTSQSDDITQVEGYEQAKTSEHHSAEVSDYDLVQCSEIANETTDCCTNPLACISETDEGVEEVTRGLGSLATMANLAGKSISTICSSMEATGEVASGINATAAAACMMKKSSCNAKCGSIEQKYATILQNECGITPVAGIQPPSGVCSEYYNVWESAKRKQISCNKYSETAINQTIQSVGQNYAAKISGLCDSYSTTSKSNKDRLDYNSEIFKKAGGDCADPVNAGSPYCQNCSDPAIANANPMCKGSSNSVKTAHGSKEDEMLGVEAENYRGQKDDLNYAASQINFGGGEVYDLKSSGIVQNNDGGLANGSDGVADLSDQGLKKNNPVAGGYNTNVLKGTEGGRAYRATSSGVSFNSRGGFSGYGNSNSKYKNNQIDLLRNFMPGAGHNPMATRHVANHRLDIAPIIGRKEGNIFYTMSKKYKQMCKLKRMWDCPEPRYKRPGM